MRKTPLRKFSDKQREKLRLWGKISNQRAEQLRIKFGKPLCEYCGKPEGEHEFWILGGHHIDRNRNHNFVENCALLHWVCHQHITDNNIKVKQEDFQGRDEMKEVQIREV